MMTRILISLWLCSSAICLAGLDFEKELHDAHATPGADKVIADFPFKNNTSEDITISKASGNCSCIGVMIKGGKFTYAPGESGVVRAEFDMGNFSGSVEKEVAVWLQGDPEKKPSITLKVIVHIPDLVEVTPKTVKWTIGEKPDTKTIRVEMKHTQPIHITDISATSKDYHIESKEISAGKSYDLLITPIDTKVLGLAAIRIITDCKISKYKSKQVFASIQRESASKTTLKP